MRPLGDDSEAAKETAARPIAVTPEVHAAAVLTGAPAAVEEEAQLERPNWSRSYSRTELFKFYEAWGERMKRLDTSWRPDDVKRLPDAALVEAVKDVIGHVENLDEYFARFPDDAEESDDEPTESVAF